MIPQLEPKTGIADDDIHWVTNIVRTCTECVRQTSHDKGVKMKAGKQIVVVECARCHTVTEVER